MRAGLVALAFVAVLFGVGHTASAGGCDSSAGDLSVPCYSYRTYHPVFYEMQPLPVLVPTGVLASGSCHPYHDCHRGFYRVQPWAPESISQESREDDAYRRWLLGREDDSVALSPAETEDVGKRLEVLRRIIGLQQP